MTGPSNARASCRRRPSRQDPAPGPAGGCGGGIDMVDSLAHAKQELIGQSFERTIPGEGGCGQRVERADALLQKLPGHLKNRLRKAVVEAQLVGAGGVVKNKMTLRYDGLAAVLKNPVYAA